MQETLLENLSLRLQRLRDQYGPFPCLEYQEMLAFASDLQIFSDTVEELQEDLKYLLTARIFK